VMIFIVLLYLKLLFDRTFYLNYDEVENEQ